MDRELIVIPGRGVVHDHICIAESAVDEQYKVSSNSNYANCGS
jgi:hypothetical protein